MQSKLRIETTSRKIAALALGTSLLALAVPGHAQDTNDAEATPPATTDTGQIAPIVVTARRQSEQLQQTPLSITALSADALEQHDVVRLDRLSQLVPNLDVAATAGSTTAANIYIRGIGTYDYQIYTDPPVTIYIDGVLNSRPGAALFDLVDLERVEVLRGPQGTLFGRNTTGGAISITTQTPDPDFGFRQRLGYGTDNEIISQSTINFGEIGTSGISARVSYAHHQRDGYVENLNGAGEDDRDPGWLNSDSIWFAVHGDIAPGLRFDYRLDYTDYAAQQPLFQMVAATQDVLNYFGMSPNYGGDPLNFGGGRVERAYAGDQAPDESQFFGTSMTVEYDVSDNLTVKNITGYRSNEISERSNIAGQGNLLGPVLDPITNTVSIEYVTPYILPLNDTRDDQFTNEFQLLGDFDSISFALGTFYLHSNGELINPNVFTFVLPGGMLGINQQLTRRMDLTTDSYAAYGQISYRPPDLNDRLELTGGLRFTRDEKTADENTTFGGAPSNVRTVSDSWENWSGLASISYQWTPDVMTYFRVSNAYRAGGFVPNTVGAYDPEEALSYEIGIKSEWFDRRLRLNASAYRTSYTDLQIQNVIQGLPVITNAGRAVFMGGEVELVALPTPDLQIRASIGYIDPEYKEYLYVDATTGQMLDVSDEAQFAGVSRVNASAGVLYTFPPLSLGTLSASLDYSYRSRKVWFPLTRIAPFNEEVASPGHNNLAARVTLSEIEAGPVDLTLELWGDNLTNELVRSGGLDFGSLGFGTIVNARGRRFGLNLRVEY